MLKQAKVLKYNHALHVQCMTATSKEIDSIEAMRFYLPYARRRLQQQKQKPKKVTMSLHWTSSTTLHNAGSLQGLRVRQTIFTQNFKID